MNFYLRVSFLLVLSFFILSKTEAQLHYILVYEYWFDDDVENRTLGFTNNTENPLLLNLSIDVSDLDVGVHSFNFRVKDNVTEDWSIVVSQTFFRFGITDANPNIISYEYWFDDDYQNKITTSVNGNPLDLNVPLDANALNEGVHSILIRFKDNTGLWSIPTVHHFLKLNSVPNGLNQITAYRYWFDTDLQTLQEVNLNNPIDTLNLLTDIEIPPSLTEGNHKVHIQFKDWREKWSVPCSRDFLFEDHCKFTDLPSSHWATEEIRYLCQQGIIAGDGNTNFTTVRPDSLINRAELASPIYRSLCLWDFPFMDSIPTPFNDIQNNIWYDTLVKKLSFLEYGDGIAPFNRERFNFNPSGYITKAHVLKVLMEAWNIQPDFGLPKSFADVPVSHDAYGYIERAKELDLIQPFDEWYCGVDSLCPNDYATRAQALALLYQIIQTRNKPDIQTDDFFHYPDITPENMASAKSGHSGNFDFHTKTSFVISDVGVPIVFGHTYNSYLADLPKEFFRVDTEEDDLNFFYLQPLGKGWSHSYHSYLLEINADDPVYVGLDLNRIVQVLPDGSIHIYKEDGNSYAPETKGVYNELRKNGDFWEVKTKNQITFRYSQPSGASATCPYLLHSIEDRNGNVISLIYEDSYQTGFKRLAQVDAAANGRDLFFYYHPESDLLERVEDPLGRQVFFDYDDLEMKGQNHLLSFKDAKGQKTEYSYGNSLAEEHLLMQIKLPKGNTINNQYNNNRRLSELTSGTETIQYAYQQNNSNGVQQIETKVTKNSTVSGTSFSRYNYLGNIEELITPKNDTIEIDYFDDVNEVLPKNIRVHGVTGDYEWDDKGNLLKANLPENVNHTFIYNGRNDITKYTDPRGNQWNFGYNNSGNLTSVETPRSTTNYTVNSKGQITTVNAPENVSVDYTYNNAGDLLNTEILAEGIQSNYAYDVIGRMLTYTNPNGVPTSYTYDANDNITSTHFIHTTAYDFDANDNLIKITNAKGHATVLDYDFDQDFLIGSTFGGFKDTYEYESDGRLKKHTDPNNHQFEYGYDSQRRLEQVESPNDLVTYTYDDRNRITAITNNAGTIKFLYDDLDRVIKTTDFWDNEVAYQYDAASNIIKITYPDGKEVKYTYAADNLLVSVEDWNGQVTNYSYREDGTLLTINYHNQTSAHYQYDQAARMTGFHWLKPNGTDTICSYQFTLDPMGQQISEYRNEPFGIPSLDDLMTNYAYDDVNRITTAGTTDFDFEPRGTAQSKGTNQYEFDDYERLTSFNADTSFVYDALGNRRSANRKQKTTRFLLDIVGLSQVLMETDESGNPIQYYVYGLGLISRVQPNTSTRYYHYDYRGSTIAMTNEFGVITHQYSYGSFGENWQVDEQDFNAYRYVGQYGVQYEGDSLYFMRARYYDAEIGRFLAEDPVWSTNLYPYAGNNPILLTDITGKAPSAPYQQRNTLEVGEYMQIGDSKHFRFKKSSTPQSDFLINTYNGVGEFTGFYAPGHSDIYSVKGDDEILDDDAFIAMYSRRRSKKTNPTPTVNLNGPSILIKSTSPDVDIEVMNNGAKLLTNQDRVIIAHINNNNSSEKENKFMSFLKRLRSKPSVIKFFGH